MPARGTTLASSVVPGGRYTVPSRDDCVACHGSAAVPVLGVGALQLSPDRDPLAAHAKPSQAGEIDLHGLVARDWLRGLPPTLLKQAPRIAADTPLERAALGYLHANCGHCHNRSGHQVPLRLTLAQSAADARGSRDAALQAVIDVPSRWHGAGVSADAKAVAPGQSDASVLVLRMRSRQAQSQMPPLGTTLTDLEGLSLVTRWIDSLPHPKETAP